MNYLKSRTVKKYNWTHTEYLYTCTKSRIVSLSYLAFDAKLKKLTEEEREMMIAKLEEAIKCLESLANRASIKKKRIDNPN